jgi:UDP-3-O-[3-hydroxymyristoyl] N-acetylglucosamine deacetylase
MRLIGYRYQRTLARPATVSGVGLITGATVRMTLTPAAADRGIVFVRTDRPGSTPIPASTASVTDTRRRTTLGPAANGVTLVEHVLSALAGLRIDNCTVELDGPEPPGMDGSAWGFVRAVRSAGVELQSARRPIRSVSAATVIVKDGATLAVYPAAGPELKLSYLLDYGPTGPIPRQSFTLTATPDDYVREVSGCRTFLLEQEVAALHAQGVGRHLTAADLLVFGPTGPIRNKLRYADEPARHKVLDLVGDLALCGFDLAGQVVAYRSGHALNVDLATRLVRAATTTATPARTRVAA